MTPETPTDCAKYQQVEDGHAHECYRTRSFAEEINDRETEKSDRHHCHENACADPHQRLEQAQFLLLEFDREQFETIMGALEQATAEAAE